LDEDTIGTPPGFADRLRAFGIALVSHATVAIGFCLLALAFVPIELAQVPMLVGALCASGIVAALVFFVPAGIGVREGALAWLLSFALPDPVAVLIALATRLWVSVADALAIITGWLVGRRRVRV
jgi:hypothetical protein